ncbi:MAG TPA: hypothetical protein VGR37_13265 [Longimicrobiaceae bacterium]|nr:hypothetical protein [Longimicrobiaceae bacterium]
MVYVLVYHRIVDPVAFWKLRERPDPGRPVHLRLVQALPSRDHGVLVCLWESDSAETVRAYTERACGAFSRNEYHEIDGDEALGYGFLLRGTGTGWLVPPTSGPARGGSPAGLPHPTQGG